MIAIQHRLAECFDHRPRMRCKELPHALRIERIDMKDYQHAFESIGNSVTSSIMGMIKGTESFDLLIVCGDGFLPFSAGLGGDRTRIDDAETASQRSLCRPRWFNSRD
jgi:hypothetical protein